MAKHLPIEKYDLSHLTREVEHMQHHTIWQENYNPLYICSLDDISYTIKATRENQSYTFLSYRIQEEENAFTHVPYDDIRFFTTVQFLLTRYFTPSFFVLVGENMERVDLPVFDRTMSTGILVEHPVWCLVANVRRERPSGPGGQTIVVGGTKHLAPGAKVYCLPSNFGDGYETVPIIARHRVSHRFIKIYTKSAWLENWRVKLIYEPVIIKKLLGFWDWTAKSRELAEHLAKVGASYSKPHPSL